MPAKTIEPTGGNTAGETRDAQDGELEVDEDGLGASDDARPGQLQAREADDDCASEDAPPGTCGIEAEQAAR